MQSLTSTRPLLRRFLAGALLAVAAFLPSPAAAFSPEMQAAIAREAGALAPPDLARQIEKHQRELRAGALLPFRDVDAARHSKDPDGAGRLDRAIGEEVRRAVAAIESHQPFEDIVTQLGVVAHYVADANNPLACSSADPREPDYFADYLGYMESALPRFPLVFYGMDRSLDQRHDVAPVVGRALARCRRRYPLVGQEYRRVGFRPGIRSFDDRSTAFGVASLAFSHAVTDVAEVYRWIWLQAGGADGRDELPNRGRTLVAVPRVTRVR